jgi:hypothetical protein
MPYNVGEKGSYGCTGYPVVKEGTSEVMGCHDTAEAAGRQIAAIEANENKSDSVWETVEPIEEVSSIKINKRYTVRENYPGCSGYAIVEIDEDGEEELEGCYQTREEAEAAARMENSSEETSDLESNVETENTIMSTIGKQDEMISEGDFVTAMTTEGMVIGQVEHVMREGGTYGEPGNPYSVNSTPENPAVAIRMLEEEDGVYYYTPYSIGALLSDTKKIPRPNISSEEYEEDYEKISKRKGGKFPSSMGQPYPASKEEAFTFASFGKDWTKSTRIKGW